MPPCLNIAMTQVAGVSTFDYRTKSVPLNIAGGPASLLLTPNLHGEGALRKSLSYASSLLNLSYKMLHSQQVSQFAYEVAVFIAARGAGCTYHRICNKKIL